MFDGLKDKLGRFKNDVEETAEEEGEQAAADEPEPEAEEVADAEADAEAPAPEAEPGAGGADAEANGGAAAEQVDAETAEASGGDQADEGEPSEPSERGAGGAGDGNDASLAERAKLFATGKAKITEEDVAEPLEALEMELLQGDVEMSVSQRIVENLREELVGATRKQVETGEMVVERAIGEALYDVISVGQFDFDERIAEADKPVTIIFTGVNGVGKTTSIAKLATYLEADGYDVVVANGDTYRAGANEQMAEHAEALDLKLISHQQGGDPAAVIYDAVEYAGANDVDVVLGDTAGRLHTSNDLMSQLEKIDRVVDPDMTLFVDEAVAGQDATNRAQQFNEAAEIDGVILTKADADAQGGAAISIAFVTGKPILFLGTGQGYDDLEPFDPQTIVDRLVGDDEADE